MKVRAKIFGSRVEPAPVEQKRVPEEQARVATRQTDVAERVSEEDKRKNLENFRAGREARALGTSSTSRSAMVRMPVPGTITAHSGFEGFDSFRIRQEALKTAKRAV